MSANLMTTVSIRPASLSLRVRIGDALGSLRAAWDQANRDAASRRNLRVLDARMLSDIGVSEAQAKFEAARWR